MQPLKLFNDLKEDMIDYITTKYPFYDQGDLKLHEQLKAILNEDGALFQDPVLQIVRRRKAADSDLKKRFPWLSDVSGFVSYEHQLKAWDRIEQGKPTVISTGTGSGKTECFMFPLIDGLLKSGYDKKGPKIGAICLYPMNALVEDQFFRFLKYLRPTGLRVGVYSGTYNGMSASRRDDTIKQIEKKYGFNFTEEERSTFLVDAERPETYPHILLTNYKMLEYMLFRKRDQEMLDFCDLKYLVLDESHVYSGTLGLDISCLLARLKVQLKEKANHLVPIATSATLATGASLEEDQKNKVRMGEFFSGLFGVEFKPDDNWLIKDEFIDFPGEDLNVFNRLKKGVDLNKVNAYRASRTNDVSAAWLKEIASGLGFSIETSLKGEASDYDYLAQRLESELRDIAPQLARAISLEPTSGKIESVVPLQVARERFLKKTGLAEDVFDALIILVSQAYEGASKKAFPLLGLRLHLFGKSEPRIFWSFDRKTLFTDTTKTSQTNLGTFVACKFCGLSGWGGRLVETGNFGLAFNDLPTFFDQEGGNTKKINEGSENVVFYDPTDIVEDLFSKDWKVIKYKRIAQPDGIYFREISGKITEKEQADFCRIYRKSKTKGESNDFEQCPGCGATANKAGSTVVAPPRGGVSTDLSVYTASLLSSIDIPDERKLLIFADNRQETSFLAGFLTDRHRRFNLRRAIASFLKEAKAKDGISSWSLLSDESVQEKALGYAFATKVLMSMQNERYSGSEKLPASKMTVTKQILSEIIPREVLGEMTSDPRSRDHANWLLGNETLEQSKDVSGATRVEDGEIRLSSPRGEWAVRVLHEVLLLEVSSGLGREGNLRALGLASWHFDELELPFFKDWLTQVGDQKVSPVQLQYLSFWFVSELARFGQWSGLSREVKNAFVGKYQQAEDKKIEEFFGKNFKTTGISAQSKIGKILKSFSEEAFEHWKKYESWLEFFQSGPLHRILHLKEDIYQLSSEKIKITSDLARYRGEISGQVTSVPANLALEGMPTGKKGEDSWKKLNQEPNAYYFNLYNKPFNEKSRLVKAQEHNGMIGGENAAEVIKRFDAQTINTVVATPTLEMGVDLPDLPVVIMKGVPPEPSNYAQRAGRAGRTPKRALLITHCGYGSHDLTFFNSPKDMVAGEIIAPGIPSQNISIIRRHVNGLILQVLARAGQTPNLDISRWDLLIPMDQVMYFEARDLQRESALKSLNESHVERKMKISRNWETDVLPRVREFFKHLENSVWKDLESQGSVIRTSLEGELTAAEWSEQFRKQLNSFTETLMDYQERYLGADKNAPANLNRVDADKYANSEKIKISNILGFYRKHSLDNNPINFLGMSSFLPSFDFPGRAIRFTGVKPYSSKSNDASSPSKTLTFVRGATSGLKEFAPEQKVYGQGFIYKIDRYEADDQKSTKFGDDWGVCSKGCRKLTRLEHSEPSEKVSCQTCGGELLGAQAHQLPKLVSITGAVGTQDSVISDGESRREHSKLIRDVRHLGIPERDDKKLTLKQMPSYSLRFFERNAQIDTATILMGVASGASGGIPSALWKEKVSKNGSVFKVSAKEDEGYEKFFPAVFSKNQAMVLQVPRVDGESKGLIVEGHNDRQYFSTLSAILERACIKVLRLNRRRTSLQFITDDMNEDPNENLVHIKRLIVMDGDEGGSGIIQVLNHYWQPIMEEAQEIVLSSCCESSCYKCIRSYENQGVHGSLDKGLFKVNSKAPFFETLAQFSDSEQVDKEDFRSDQETDPSSPIEPYFKDILDDLGLVYETQAAVEGRDEKGIITRPDFVIGEEQGNSGRVWFYIDGKHHVETLKKDILKRNELFFQNKRWGALCGHYAWRLSREENVQLGIKEMLKTESRRHKPGNHSEIVKSHATRIAETATSEIYTLDENVPEHDKKQLGAYHKIDTNQFKELLLGKTLRSSLFLGEVFSELLPDEMPVAIEGSRLIWEVSESSIRKVPDFWPWRRRLLLQSFLTFYGFLHYQIYND